MTMIRCPNGHFFDPQKHPNCPHCGVQNLDMQHPRPAVSGGNYQPQRPYAEDAPTIGRPEHRQAPRDEPTVGRPGSGRVSIDDAVTIGHWQKKLGIKPVSGWLVAIEGPEKGRDFRFHTGRNSIGRHPENQICLAADEAVSRSNHASVVYDPLTNTYHLVPGIANELVYCNEQPVFMALQINAYDKIRLGESLLLFVPTCGEHFRWS